MKLSNWFVYRMIKERKLPKFSIKTGMWDDIPSLRKQFSWIALLVMMYFFLRMLYDIYTYKGIGFWVFVDAMFLVVFLLINRSYSKWEKEEGIK